MQELNSIFRGMWGLQELQNVLLTPAATAPMCISAYSMPPQQTATWHRLWLCPTEPPRYWKTQHEGTALPAAQPASPVSSIQQQPDAQSLTQLNKIGLSMSTVFMATLCLKSLFSTFCWVLGSLCTFLLLCYPSRKEQQDHFLSPGEMSFSHTAVKAELIIR